jgi:RimJ/RimL family protein N-acetyltransferase
MIGECGSVSLRNVIDEDLDVFFRHQQDTESNQLAVVYPRERADFDAHWDRIRKNPGVIARAILFNGVVAGNINSYTVEDEHFVGYWIDRGLWGKGITSKALKLFLDVSAARPMNARVATSNIGSMRVLERCGFKLISTRMSPEDDQYPVCEEAFYKLV